MEIKIDMRRYINTIKKFFWFIGLVTLVSFFIALIVNFKVDDDKYVAFANVYSASLGSYTDSVEGVSALRTYSDIITSRKVANRAAMMIGDDKITGEDIQPMISYSFSESSTVYYIYAESTDPNITITVANAVANAFVTELNNIIGEEHAQILDEAYEYKMSYDGREEQLKGIIYITLAGFILSVLFVVGYSFFSSKVVSVNDVTLNGEIEILGVIPNFDVE